MAKYIEIGATTGVEREVTRAHIDQALADYQPQLRDAMKRKLQAGGDIHDRYGNTFRRANRPYGWEHVG